MAVIGYQLFIIFTLIVLKLFGDGKLLFGSIVWSGLTLINLFFPPLILVQLLVIWGTYGFLVSKSPKSSA